MNKTTRGISEIMNFKGTYYYYFSNRRMAHCQDIVQKRKYQILMNYLSMASSLRQSLRDSSMRLILSRTKLPDLKLSLFDIQSTPVGIHPSNKPRQRYQPSYMSWHFELFKPGIASLSNGINLCLFLRPGGMVFV
jgi:hypothetical protein